VTRHALDSSLYLLLSSEQALALYKQVHDVEAPRQWQESGGRAAVSLSPPTLLPTTPTHPPPLQALPPKNNRPIKPAHMPPPPLPPYHILAVLPLLLARPQLSLRRMTQLRNRKPGAVPASEDTPAPPHGPTAAAWGKRPWTAGFWRGVLCGGLAALLLTWLAQVASWSDIGASQ